MYVTRAVNGVPAIQRGGRNVMSVCNQDWEFASWLCELLNELGRKSELLQTGQDWAWLNANSRIVQETPHHA